MSNDATVNESTDVESDETAAETPLSEFGQQVREFQLLFSDELHRLADAGNLCSTFDAVMNEHGLPARPRHTTEGSKDNYGYSDYHYQGNDILTEIDNEDDAKRWAVQVSKGLINATDAYGYREVYDSANGRHVRLTEFLEYFGMPARKTVDVKVTGTFEVTFAVNTWDDGNLIDDVSVWTVADQVSGAIGREAAGVQWKVQKTDS